MVLLASGQTWVEGRAAIGGGSLPLAADGGDVTGIPTALAIVGLAALVAVFAVRSAGRLLVSGTAGTLRRRRGGRRPYSAPPTAAH